MSLAWEVRRISWGSGASSGREGERGEKKGD